LEITFPYKNEKLFRGKHTHPVSNMSTPAMVCGPAAQPSLGHIAHVDELVAIPINTPVPTGIGHLLAAELSLELVAQVLVLELVHLAPLHPYVRPPYPCYILPVP
jgi:hypothetical protein